MQISKHFLSAMLMLLFQAPVNASEALFQNPYDQWLYTAKQTALNLGDICSKEPSPTLPAGETLHSVTAEVQAVYEKLTAATDIHAAKLTEEHQHAINAQLNNLKVKLSCS